MNARTCLVALAIVSSSFACVSTQVVKGGPDPRAGRAPPPPPPAPLTVVDDRQPADPIINVRLVFRVGSASDPVGKEGLTALTARLMAEATTELSASALADAPLRVVSLEPLSP